MRTPVGMNTARFTNKSLHTSVVLASVALLVRPSAGAANPKFARAREAMMVVIVNLIVSFCGLYKFEVG